MKSRRKTISGPRRGKAERPCLEEYQALGRRIKRLQERRDDIFNFVEASGRKLTEGDWTGVIKTQRREQMEKILTCCEKLTRAKLEELGLIKTVTYDKLVVVKTKRRAS